MTLTKEEERWLEEIYYEAASDDPKGPFGPNGGLDPYELPESPYRLAEGLESVYLPKSNSNHYERQQ